MTPIRPDSYTPFTQHQHLAAQFMAAMLVNPAECSIERLSSDAITAADTFIRLYNERAAAGKA